MFMYKTFCIL